jgi:hypothetical protein
MAINPRSPFKERHFPGEVIVLCVCWYLQYPLAYEHVSKLLAERGVEVDQSFIWRLVQMYAPERKKRCRPHPMETTPSASSKEDSREHHIRRRSFSHTLRKAGPHPDLPTASSWLLMPDYRSHVAVLPQLAPQSERAYL